MDEGFHFWEHAGTCCIWLSSNPDLLERMLRTRAAVAIARFRRQEPGVRDPHT